REAWGYRADPNPVTGQFERPDHGHRGDARLGRGVVGLTHVAEARDAGDVHDHPAAAELDHAFRSLATAQEYAGQVHIDDGLPLLEAHLAGHRAVLALDEQGVADNSGVIDDAVEPSQLG